LERLKQYVGQTFEAKVIDIDEREEKLIVSEKAAWEEKQRDVLSQYPVGSIIEGTVTVIPPFGAFVQFGEGLEGLIHISELSEERVEKPSDVIKKGDKPKAMVISVDKEAKKIALSIKAAAHGGEYKSTDKVKAATLADKFKDLK
jgi:small subunit ribosomal protein S1